MPMRYAALLFLSLTALNRPPHGHHPTPWNWQLRAHDGVPSGNFGRRFRREDGAEQLRAPARLDRLDVGNGTEIGVGLVHGRHVGFKLKLPF